MRRLSPPALAALILCLSTARVTPSRAAHSRTSVEPAAAVPSLLVEPRDGVRPLTRLIDRAQSRIFVECYILSNRNVVRALQRAQAQGVQVNVLLEHHPFGLGDQPERAMATVRASGISARWSSPRFALTHAKMIVIDDRTAVISTANLSLAGFTRDRDFVYVDRSRRDARFLSNLFRRDWDRLKATGQDGPLVLSPEHSRAEITALLLSARHSADLYTEEVADPSMERLLGSMVRRGVRVRLLLPWNATPDAVAGLARSGVSVRELRAPYIHAKAIVVDGRRAFMGSENLSSQSLDRNREVGVMLRPGIGIRLLSIFFRDWRHGHAVSIGTGKPR